MKQEMSRHVIIDLDTGKFMSGIDYTTYGYKWSFTHKIHAASFNSKKELELLLESRFSKIYPAPKEIRIANLKVREIKITYEY